MDDELRIDEIEAWFHDRGYEVRFDRVGESYVALVMRGDARVGAGAKFEGATRAEAAQSAKASFDTTTTVGRSLTLPYEVHGVDEGHAEESASVTIDAPTAEARAEAPLPEVERLERVATKYGWRIGFFDESDGSVSGYLMDESSGEVLKSVVGADFHDGVLRLMEETYPPSEEGRQR